MFRFRNTVHNIGKIKQTDHKRHGRVSYVNRLPKATGQEKAEEVDIDRMRKGVK